MKKYILIVLALLVIALFWILKNQPEMKTITENNTWDLFITTDFKDDNYLQANITQKNEEDVITLKNIDIVDNETNEVVMSDDIKSIQMVNVEGYEVQLEPIYVEVPLSMSIKKGRSYTLEITYVFKNNTYTDKIEFK